MEMKLPAYQKILFKNEDGNLLKSADIQRKCLVHMVKASSISLDNSSTCRLLQDKLEKYSQTVENDGENIYTSRLRSLLEKTKKVPRPESFRSNLENLNPTNLLAPLSCTQSGSKCAVSEKMSEGEFQEFYKTMSKNKPFSKLGLIPQLSGPTIHARSEQTSSDNFRERKIVRCPENNKNLLFKTARDELQQQNAKKHGNSYAQQSNPQQNTTGQKRKLGTRRNINSKFVSPLLTNNESNEDIKSDEWSTETDERYKNVDPKMVELIKSEIMDCGPNIHWNDIAGLKFAKTAIQEAVVWPMLRPDIFTGLRRPPKGILLFGPPGTGKTLIGKCVASQSKSTFFSISASSLTSKWVGDGEKMVRALFVVARGHQSSVIFIDEIDSLLSQRSDTEHESSRRIKTEFLVQLDGATTDSEERILVIGATNRPQELDEAARRRFVKRLYIPLPEFDARLQLVHKLISSENHLLTGDNFKEIAQSSEGYSGADIRNLCSEASLGPIRSIDMSLIEHISASQVRPLQKEDFDKAFCRVRSSVSPKDLEQYIVWDSTYGSGSGF